MPENDRHIAAGRSAADEPDGSRKRPVSDSAPNGGKTDQPVRAINEDDDGYDPYSDLHDKPTADPLFERDPWD